MSFRQFGGLNYAAKHNAVASNYNSSNNLQVTQNVGQPNSYINFLSDISGNFQSNQVGDISGNTSSVTNLSGGSAGSIPYQTETGTTSFLPIGTQNQALLVGNNNLPQWSTLPTSQWTTSGSNIYYNQAGQMQIINSAPPSLNPK